MQSIADNCIDKLGGQQSMKTGDVANDTIRYDTRR